MGNKMCTCSSEEPAADKGNVNLEAPPNIHAEMNKLMPVTEKFEESIQQFSPNNYNGDHIEENKDQANDNKITDSNRMDTELCEEMINEENRYRRGNDDNIDKAVTHYLLFSSLGRWQF